MAGTSWRAVSVPTQKSNGDLPRGPGQVTASPGRAGTGDARTIPAGTGPPARRANVGLVGAWARTPDDASFDWGANGFRITMHIAARTWRPGFTQWFCSQGGDIAGSMGFAFTQHADGKFRTAISDDGTNILGLESVNPVPADYPKNAWIRTQVVDDFAGLQFYSYWISTNGQDWDDLGGPRSTSPGIVMNNSVRDLLIPGFVGDSEQVTFEAKFETNILTTPTTVAYAQFDTYRPRTTTFTDTPRRTWTVDATGFVAVV